MKSNKEKINSETFEVDEEVDNAESKDIIEAFLDNSAKVLHESFLGKKRQLINAMNGKSDIYEKLRQKSKALDMINMILSSNKELLKNDDLNYSNDLKLVFSQAKNDKNVFENISKR